MIFMLCLYLVGLFYLMFGYDFVQVMANTRAHSRREGDVNEDQQVPIQGINSLLILLMINKWGMLR